MIYPWHEHAWQQLAAHLHNTPNAWLFTGRQNTGKTAFALHVAQTLLCEQSAADDQPCGACVSCHLFSLHTHPDFYLLAPDEGDAEVSGSRKTAHIKIDSVRSMLDAVMQTAVRGGRRIVLINPAESLNVQAANALLKILEEPPPELVFILVSHNKDRLLPTIKSRCRHLLLPAPDHAAALDYLHAQHTDDAENLLAFHSGAPLFQAAPEQDALREKLLDILAAPRLLAILDYAAEFERSRLPLAALLDWLHKWFADTALAARSLPPLYYPHHAEGSRRAAGRIAASELFRLYDTLNRLHPYGQHSLNVKMQTESLLCAYLSAITRKTAFQAA